MYKIVTQSPTHGGKLAEVICGYLGRDKDRIRELEVMMGLVPAVMVSELPERGGRDLFNILYGEPPWTARERVEGQKFTVEPTGFDKWIFESALKKAQSTGYITKFNEIYETESGR